MINKINLAKRSFKNDLERYPSISDWHVIILWQVLDLFIEQTADSTYSDRASHKQTPQKPSWRRNWQHPVDFDNKNMNIRMIWQNFCWFYYIIRECIFLFNIWIFLCLVCCFKISFNSLPYTSSVCNNSFQNIEIRVIMFRLVIRRV